MTKEEFNSVIKKICTNHSDITPDKEYGTICMRAAKKETPEEAFESLATELLLEREKRKNLEKENKGTYALAYAFVMYLYGNSLDTEKITDKEFLNFQLKMFNALAYMLDKMKNEYPDINIGDSEELLEITQNCLEDVAANFKVVVESPDSYAELHPADADDDTDEADDTNDVEDKTVKPVKANKAVSQLPPKENKAVNKGNLGK